MNSAMTTIVQALSTSKYKQQFTKSQRIETHEILRQTHLIDKKLKPDEYCFMIIQPTNKILQWFREKGKEAPAYKILKLPKRQDVRVLLITQIISQHYGISKTETLFLFTMNGNILNNQVTILDIYTKFKDPQDDFVYIKFSNTESF